MARSLTVQEGHHRPLPVADLDHGLGTSAVTIGVLGLVLDAVSVPLGGVVAGIVGMVLGLWAQMISRSRAERFVDLTGLLLSFLALAVALAVRT